MRDARVGDLLARADLQPLAARQPRHRSDTRIRDAPAPEQTQLLQLATAREITEARVGDLLATGQAQALERRRAREMREPCARHVRTSDQTQIAQLRQP